MKNLLIKPSAPSKLGQVTIYFVFGHTRFSTQISCRAENLVVEDCGFSAKIMPAEDEADFKNMKLQSMKSKLLREINYREPTEKEFSSLCIELFDQKRLKKKEAAEKLNNLYLPFHLEYITMLTKPNTIQTYRLTAQHVKAFDPTCTFESMDLRWLERFEKWLASRGSNTNGIGLHMRNIRAVFNKAIKAELTTKYPFKYYSIRKEVTRKRCLTVEQLRELRDFPCTKLQVRYRDIFMLMVYMRGINPVDLFTATPDMVVNGRLEYQRSKTGAFLSVKIEPEAQAIIDKYKGTRLLLNVGENCEWRTFNQHMQRELKKFGVPMRKKGEPKRTPEQIRQLAAFPDLTPYWSRHTWATLAAEIDTPKETIAQGLSHAWANVTDTYIKFNERKVDEANRNVIDYINGTYKTISQLEQEKQDLQEQIKVLLERLSKQSVAVLV